MTLLFPSPINEKGDLIVNKTNVKLNKLFYYLKNASLMKIKAFKKNRVRQCCREFEELQFKKKKGS
jgi:hypothetical protein